MNRFILVACALLSLTGTAMAQENAEPNGFPQCRASGIEGCTPQYGSAAADTIAHMPLVIRDHDRVDASIAYKTTNVWYVALNGGTGDCKIYALTTKVLLQRDGISPGALPLATVQVKDTGAIHEVLLWKTTSGTYVLDNPGGEGDTDKLMTMSEASAKYDFISIQDQNGTWVLQNPGRELKITLEVANDLR